MRGDEPKFSARKLWSAWAFAAVPAVGIVELALHVVQTRAVVPDRDWQAAKAFVAAEALPEDLVTFAPRWIDPVGREQFGPQIATIAREARGDDTPFPRAFEVTIRGAHDPSLIRWKTSATRRFGAVTVTTRQNPSPVRVLSELVTMVEPGHLRVTRVDGDRETDCPFEHAGIQTGGLGFGTPIPGDKFSCRGASFVGASIMEDSGYYPRRCVYAPPFGGSPVLRLRFSGVLFGRALHGNHSIYVEAEHGDRSPVSLTFRVGDSIVGRAVHRDREGWKTFEFDTSDLAGQRLDLVVDIESSTSDRRNYCFEADTR